MNKDKATTFATEALEAVALQNGTSIDCVRREIALAIAAAQNDPNPAAQAFWEAVPHAGELPTPEEVIAYIAKNV